MANATEYGLFQLLDLGLLDPTTTTVAANSDLLISAIQYDNAQHNADINAILRLFAEDTTEFQLEVQQVGSNRNQPLDENGRSLPIKPIAPYTAAFPIQGSGNAWGANYVTQQQMTVKEMANTLAAMYRGDVVWVRDHVMGQLFANVSYTHRDPTGKGNLTIRGLANSDTTVYYKNSADGLATDTHYFAQAAGIADATNPYPTLRDALVEHPINGGEIIAFIASNLVATTQALAEFRSAQLEPDIQLGANVTRLNEALGVGLQGRPSINGMQLPPRSTVRGKTDSGVWIVEWPSLPSSYIIAITSDGPRPLYRRQFPQAQLQGFRAQGERNDWPYFESQWARWEGFGAFNRVGAAVARIGNASYAIPANMGMPMR